MASKVQKSSQSQLKQQNKLNEPQHIEHQHLITRKHESRM